MTINLATDSDGNDFQIWPQEQAMSCGIASIWMARGMARQMTIDESEWELAYRTYHAAIAGMTWLTGPPPIEPHPVTLDPDAHGNSQNSLEMTMSRAGMFPTQVKDMLRQEGFNVVHTENNGTSRMIDTGKIGIGRPAIVLVGWYPPSMGGSRDGGHFVVAARRSNSAQIVFLDPWGGVLREVSNTSRYPGNGMIEEILYVNVPN